MNTKSLYENYSIGFSEDFDSFNNLDEGYYFIFNRKDEIYLKEDKSIPIFKKNQLNRFSVNLILYIGIYKNKPCFVANVDDDVIFTPLNELYVIDKDDYRMATRAILVIRWYKSHQYCGACATKTVLDEKDMMLKCPKCGQVHYTRIAPVVIVSIIKDGQLLMAKHTYHKVDRYALIAGFVEAGETVEEALHREVMEEVGIKIKNLQYVSSQSWPYPNSLMLGFTAQYDSGKIQVDNYEISTARWFKPEEIGKPKSDRSISSFLVNNFLDKYG